jgi:hypothetical protein
MPKPRSKDEVHRQGPGLRFLGEPTTWYGGGYCGICGDRSESLVPRAVRWWDPDDGWRTGVLCVSCGRDASARGPRPDDYATHQQERQALMADTLAELGDMDSAHTDYEDLRGGL